MSIFGSIMSKIFHGGEASAAPAPQTQTADAGTGGGAPSAPPAAGAAPGGTPAPAGNASAPAGTPASGGAPVDVAAVLNGLAAKSGQTLDWKHSIVDLMKLLDLDSGLAARKQLASELHYTGSTDDSAAMNVWLHKQVMQKLADNGGKVPDDLKN